MSKGNKKKSGAVNPNSRRARSKRAEQVEMNDESMFSNFGSNISSRLSPRIAEGAARARGFVEENANLTTLGFGLIAVGAIALISSTAGRNLIRSTSNAVMSLINDDSEVETASPSRRPSRDNEYARS